MRASADRSARRLLCAATATRAQAAPLRSAAVCVRASRMAHGASLLPAPARRRGGREPCRSCAHHGPCSGAGSAPPCCGSCSTSTRSQTPTACPFPRPRAPSRAATTLFQPSIVDEIREILHVPPAGEQPGGAPAPDLGEQAARPRSLQAHGWLHPLKRRGPWRGKARCLSRAARSRSLASRAPRSTTVCACASAPALRRPYSAHVRTARATCAVCTQGRSAGA